MLSLKRIFGSGFGVKVGAFLVAAAMLSVPIGCSKKEEAASTKKAPEVQQQTPDDPAREHFEKGVRLSLQKDYEAAIAEYEKSLEYNPQSAPAYNNLGFAYYDKGDIDKAIEAQKKALDIDPQLPNGYYGLALALEKKGDEEGALENWKAFIKYAEPHSKWWIKAQERITSIENPEGADAKEAGKGEDK